MLDICAHQISANHWIRLKTVTRFETLERLIDERYNALFTINEASEILNMSSSHLSRLIKERYGTTFTSQMNKRRIEAAKEYLTSTGMTVSETVYECGFDDSRYFMRIFKQ